MAEARLSREWERTAAGLAQFYNANRDPKKSRVMHPDDFNPFGKPSQRSGPLPKQNVRELKGVIMEAMGAKDSTRPKGVNHG